MSTNSPHVLDGAKFYFRVTDYNDKTYKASTKLRRSTAALRVRIPGLVSILQQADPMCNGEMDQENSSDDDCSDLSAVMEDAERRARTPSVPNFGIKRFQIIARLEGCSNHCC